MAINPHEELYFNIIEISQRLEKNIKIALKPHELTHAQFNVLRILKGAKNNDISAKIIKQKMILNNPDITRLIDRLVSKKLVNRQINPQNKRQTLISLTSNGVEKLEILNPIMYNAVQNFFKSSISLNDASTALHTLKIMNSHLKDPSI